jgi:DNA mismatch repair protein MutS
MEDKQTMISKTVTMYYNKFVGEFIQTFSDKLDSLIKMLIDIDIAYCNAKNAYEFRYNRPMIGNTSVSYIKARNIRHPIIERIDDSIPYVGNDINLQHRGAGAQNGMLLYGINAAGKSSLMKSVGLNIIMAQAGMYVPCDTMEYVPYKHIFTRISGMDNIFKGMSSFTVEMTELRNILQRCDKYSLVLGDEICSGTEATSALAIVAAGIDTLVQKQSAFIFATHLHELPDLDVVKMHVDSKYIAINHIHITIDDNNRIVYERKIREGRGESTYGIRVCESLDMPLEFMKTAENIRKQLEGHSTFLINPKKSRYNKDVYMTKCSLCQVNDAEDTHHIKYQCDSDQDGFFKDFHKNAKHNLIALCKECHMKEHHGEIDIKGYIKTSEGIVIEHNPSTCHQVDAANVEEITEDELNTLKQYIKRGRCNWYMRTLKTNAFKKCTDVKKIMVRLQKVLNRPYELSDHIANHLYDPMM